MIIGLLEIQNITIMEHVNILIENCNNCSLYCSAKVGLKLYKEYTIRHPQAFYLRGRVKGWDGMVHFISKAANFKIGLLPSVINRCKELGYKVEIEDNRRELGVKPNVIKSIGSFKLRPEQIKAVESIIKNKVEEIPYHIGVIDYTVNAGKSLIMAALYFSFKKKLKTLMITQDSDWLNQAKREFKDYLPGEDITFVQGSKVFNWSNFSIGMIQSLSRNLKGYQNELAKIDMVLVDEADLAGSKSYQKVLTHLYNTRVRIGLSGTIYMSKLVKDKLKNMELRSFFGDIIAQFKLSDSIKKGYSTNTIVKIVDPKPYYGNWEPKANNYPDEYTEVITENPTAWCLIKNRLEYNISYGRLPALIVCKYVKQAENIYNYLRDTLDKKYNIACAHVNTKTKERNNIMEGFRSGKIDILVSTTIIARGKNFPLLRYMINTSDSNSEEKNIQFLGRLVRTCEGKDKVYLDDISYPGHYLSRHGRHRKNYYKKQNLKVISLGRGRVKDACDNDLPF